MNKNDSLFRDPAHGLPEVQKSYPPNVHDAIAARRPALFLPSTPPVRRLLVYDPLPNMRLGTVSVGDTDGDCCDD
jgi:hypothetical protein